MANSRVAAAGARRGLPLSRDVKQRLSNGVADRSGSGTDGARKRLDDSFLTATVIALPDLQLRASTNGSAAVPGAVINKDDVNFRIRQHYDSRLHIGAPKLSRDLSGREE
ncbi:MAG: hypothetical protein IPI83_14090 [Sphingomonadales bacterium]|nr:hypothetical protein [Sphingomonadales bacterium]